MTPSNSAVSSALVPPSPFTEGWKHFQQGREAIEREFARAPESIRRRIRWLPIGDEVQLTA